MSVTNRLCLILLVSAAVAIAGCGRVTRPAAAPGSAEAAEREAQDEISDLDQPMETLLAARCEHQMPTYTCDECRYEVGFVKVVGLVDLPGGVTLARVERRPVAETLEVNGEVVLNEARAAFLAPPAAGVVRALHVDIGQLVSTGQLLYEVDSPEVSEARADYVTASAEAELAAATLTRETDLQARRISAEKDLLDARAGQRRADAAVLAGRERLRRFGLPDADLKALAGGGTGSPWLQVRAPFAGRVLERNLGLGALTSPGDRALLLADTTRLWVLATVAEREVAAVLTGQDGGGMAAAVTVPAYPDKVFAGRIERVGGTLDPATRTVRARVVVDNPDDALRAGMQARVRLSLPGQDRVLAVPAAVVLEDEGRSFVFVRHDQEYFVRRPVITGRTWDGWVEVRGGLDEGVIVVAQGGFLLKSDVLRSKMGAGCAD